LLCWDIVTTADGFSHGIWSVEESAKSTWCELVAVYRILKSMVHLLANQRVKWFTDNQGVVSIVSKGSMKSDLQSFAMSIYKICMINSVVLDTE
jgi:hypothetical protein